MSIARTQPTAIWIALIACAILAFVPGPGLVLCLQSSGGIDLGVGAHGACPCRPDLDGTHPPCVDVHIDGLRDRLPADLPAPIIQPLHWIAIALEVPVWSPPLGAGPDPNSRAGPPPDDAVHARRRALDARRSVLLTI